ncbi:siderophore ABC transporter substrate-binding protein [Virgibacillus kimchii]
MKKIIYICMIGLLGVIVAACGSSDASDGSNADTDDEMVTITHELGETDVKKNPQEVVVFDFGMLDTLDALELDVVAGIPKGNTPDYLQKYEADEYENVGSLKEPDFEKIAEIDPDLIIISARQAELYDQFMELAPTVHLGVDTTRYMDSFKENMEAIAHIFDKQEEIEQELTEMENTISEIQENTTEMNENALIIMANDDKISAYGPSSRFGIIHDEFDVPAVDDGIEASTHGMNVSFEYVTSQDPDRLYVIDRGAAVNGESNAQQIVENELVKNTKVYENDNIYYLNPDYWYLSGGGLISVNEMIKEIQESLD